MAAAAAPVDEVVVEREVVTAVGWPSMTDVTTLVMTEVGAVCVAVEVVTEEREVGLLVPVVVVVVPVRV